MQHSKMNKLYELKNNIKKYGYEDDTDRPTFYHIKISDIPPEFNTDFRNYLLKNELYVHYDWVTEEDLCSASFLDDFIESLKYKRDCNF